MHDLAASLNPQGDLELENVVSSDGVQTSLLEGVVPDGVLVCNDEDKVAVPVTTKTLESILTYPEESCGVSKLKPVKSALVNFNTRHSSRIQEKKGAIQDKLKARTANAKGTKFIPSSSYSTDTCSLDSMARVCGFSLGQDEVSRIANISLIQAKEDAFIALQKTKQKIESSSVIPNDTIIRVPLEIESSVDLSPQVLELMGGGADTANKLSHRDQG